MQKKPFLLWLLGWHPKVQTFVNLVDLVGSFPTSIYLQTLALIQPRTSLCKSLPKISHVCQKLAKYTFEKKPTGQTPDTLSGVCETLKLYKPYGVTFSKIGFWDGPPLPLPRALQSRT